MPSVIYITKASKAIFRHNVEQLLLYNTSSEFTITLIKKYKGIDIDLLPLDLVNIIMSYIHDVINIKCVIEGLCDAYSLRMKTDNVWIGCSEYVFDYSINIDTEKILTAYEDYMTNKHSMWFDRLCGYYNEDITEFQWYEQYMHLPRPLIILIMHGSNSIYEIPEYDMYERRPNNHINICNSYMASYYKKQDYINIGCNHYNYKIPYNKKMKNMIIIIKLLLYTFMNKHE